MKMYAPGDEIWFDTVGIYTIPAWRTKQKYYHGTVKYALGHEHGYNYWVDIGFGESVLIHDWNILTRAPYYDDDFIKDIREEYKEESEKIRDDVVDKLDKILMVPARGSGKTYKIIGKMIQEGLGLGIKDWCKESNHVFEVGEFATVIKDDTHRGQIVRITDTIYNPKNGEHTYLAKFRPEDNFVRRYKQGEIELTITKPKCWEEKEMDDKVFIKSKLRSGMMVVTRDETKYLVMPTSWGGLGLSNMNSSIPLNNYTDEMVYFKDRHKDIVKVYDLPVETRHIGCLFSTDETYKSVFGNTYPLRGLLWERSEAREMTVAEIEKELGYSIKVVK